MWTVPYCETYFWAHRIFHNARAHALSFRNLCNKLFRSRILSRILAVIHGSKRYFRRTSLMNMFRMLVSKSPKRPWQPYFINITRPVNSKPVYIFQNLLKIFLTVLFFFFLNSVKDLIWTPLMGVWLGSDIISSAINNVIFTDTILYDTLLLSFLHVITYRMINSWLWCSSNSCRGINQLPETSRGNQM